MKNKCVIRVATKADLDLLPDLEDRADQAYKNMPRFAPMFEREGLTIEQCHNLPPSSQVWVAEAEKVVGFVLTQNIDNMTYLAQISVVPEHQGFGIGTALMNVAITKAQEDGKRAIVLATYSDVVFNGPYYAKHGFSELSEREMGAQLAQLAIEDEKQWGCFSPRIIMGKFFF